MIPVKKALMEQLKTDNMTIIFGNPGTTEENFLDVLTDFPEIRYVTGLQESIVVAMADGYARVSQRPGIVQIHSTVGLGNSVAMLYQAYRSFTPMVAFASEVNASQSYDSFLAGNLIDIAKPVTKWAIRINEPGQFLRIWRRALKVAMTPPQGPVFIAIPMEFFDAMIEATIEPTTWIDWHSSPSQPIIEKAVELLLNAASPLFLIGDQVYLTNAQNEIKQLAEMIGAPVYGLDYADPNASFKDPLFMGLVGHSFGEHTREITLQSDAVLIVGTPVFPELFPSEKSYFKEGAKLIQVDLNPWEIAKNFRVDVPIQADPKSTLGMILETLKPRLTSNQKYLINIRTDQWMERKKDEWKKRQLNYESQKGKHPLAPSEMCEIIVNNLPSDYLIYDELITTTEKFLHYLQPDRSGQYFLGRGGCIGVGVPGAIGAKLACPSKNVFATSGDGSALFVIQALWTALNQNLDLTFLIANNHAYRILKVNLLNYWNEKGIDTRKFPSMMDLTSPSIDFVKIAEGFGAHGHYAASPSELQNAIQDSLKTGGVHLIDVQIDGSI